MEVPPQGFSTDCWRLNELLMYFYITGSVYLQCHRDDPSDLGEVCLSNVGPSNRLVHGFVIYGADPWIRPFHVLHHQGQHQTGTTHPAFNI